MTLSEFRSYVIRELDQFCEHAIARHLADPITYPGLREIMDWESEYQEWLQQELND